MDRKAATITEGIPSSGLEEPRYYWNPVIGEGPLSSKS